MDLIGQMHQLLHENMELLESKVTLELGLELINPINYHKIKSMLYNVSWHNKKTILGGTKGKDLRVSQKEFI